MLPRTILVIGAIVFLCGVTTRIGLHFYERALIQEAIATFESGASIIVESSENLGVQSPPEPVDELRYIRLRNAVHLSYALMALGSAIMSYGLIRNRRVAVCYEMKDAEQE